MRNSSKSCSAVFCESEFKSLRGHLSEPSTKTRTIHDENPFFDDISLCHGKALRSPNSLKTRYVGDLKTFSGLWHARCFSCIYKNMWLKTEGVH